MATESAMRGRLEALHRIPSDMGLGEMRYGIPAITLTVPWKMGMNDAKQMVLGGIDIPAREAKARGMITTVFTRDEFTAVTDKTALAEANEPFDALDSG